jgi:hypothetical protein
MFSTVVQSGRNHSPATTSDGQITHQNAMQNSHSDTTQGKRDGQGTTQKHAKPYLKNSQNEQHFPGSDPAHGSANVRIAGGTVGPARRHVGVINSTRQFAGRSGSQMHAPSGSSHANIQRGSFTSVGASGRYPAFMSRNIQQNQRPDTIFHGRPTGRSFVVQNVNRYHQGPTSNQKGIVFQLCLCFFFVSRRVDIKMLVFVSSNIVRACSVNPQSEGIGGHFGGYNPLQVKIPLNPLQYSPIPLDWELNKP